MSQDVAFMNPAAYSSEPWGMLDAVELPEIYGVDDVFILYQSPSWIFVYFEFTDRKLIMAKEQLGSSSQDARRVLRMISIPADFIASSNRNERQTIDSFVDWNHGQRYLHVPLAGSKVRVASGLLSSEGYFVAIAESPWVQLPKAKIQAELSKKWMRVEYGEIPSNPGENQSMLRKIYYRELALQRISDPPQKNVIDNTESNCLEGSPSLGHGSGGIY